MSFLAKICIFSVSVAAPISKPENPFGEASKESEELEYEDETSHSKSTSAAARGATTSSKSAQESDEKEYYDDDESTRPPIVIPNQKVTPSPVRENIMYTLLPTMQKKTIMYCPYNQYTFSLTCRPGKKIRYDLQVQ